MAIHSIKCKRTLTFWHYLAIFLAALAVFAYIESEVHKPVEAIGSQSERALTTFVLSNILPNTKLDSVAPATSEVDIALGQEDKNLPQPPKFGMAAIGSDGAWDGNGARHDERGNECLNLNELVTATLRTILPPSGANDPCGYFHEFYGRAKSTNTPEDILLAFAHINNNDVFVDQIEQFQLSGKWGVHDFEQLASYHLGPLGALALYLTLKKLGSPVAEDLAKRRDTILSMELDKYLQTGNCDFGLTDLNTQFCP